LRQSFQRNCTEVAIFEKAARESVRGCDPDMDLQRRIETCLNISIIDGSDVRS
jgi:hypothetical protein